MGWTEATSHAGQGTRTIAECVHGVLIRDEAGSAERPQKRKYRKGWAAVPEKTTIAVTAMP
jgi:hypothetical protein